MRASSNHTAAGGALLAGLMALAPLVGSVGCRGCVDGGDEGPGGAAQGTPHAKPAAAPKLSRSERVQARLDALGLPENPSFPRAADGALACGIRIDCFIHAAKSCQPAVLDYRQSVVSYGLVQTVISRYAILGRGESGCRVARVRGSYGVALEPEMAEALAGGGKSPEQIEQLRLEAEAMLGAKNPARLECELDDASALEVALDLVDGRHRPGHWRGHCKTPEEAAAGIEPPGEDAVPVPPPAAGADTDSPGGSPSRSPTTAPH